VGVRVFDDPLRVFLGNDSLKPDETEGMLWEMLASHIDRLHFWLPYGVAGFAILGFVGAWALEKLWKHEGSVNKKDSQERHSRQ
jgi:hypothetical protein